MEIVPESKRSKTARKMRVQSGDREPLWKAFPGAVGLFELHKVEFSDEFMIEFAEFWEENEEVNYNFFLIL